MTKASAAVRHLQAAGMCGEAPASVDLANRWHPMCAAIFAVAPRWLRNLDPIA